jgi:hypothetical protein
MRVLSIRQPFAALVVCGLKRFEARTWSTPYRGEIAIHASSVVTRAAMDEMLKDELFRTAMELAEIDDARTLPQRAIVGTAVLKDIHTAREVAARDNVVEIDFVLCGGDLHEEDQLWRLEEPTELQNPIPINGKLNLWTLPEKAAVRVRRAKHLPPIISAVGWQETIRYAPPSK